jgi:hypothetical protein
MTQGKLTEVAGDLQEGEQILIVPATAPTGFRAFEQ